MRPSTDRQSAYARLAMPNLLNTFADGTLKDILRHPYTRESLNALLKRVETNELRGPAAVVVPETKPQSHAVSYASTKILVADDQEANLEVIGAAFAVYDIVPTTVVDGREAMAACTEN